MTSLTQLFKMVSANDYEGLNKLLGGKNPVELNSYKGGQSLISRAIEVRAKECFDLILENPNNSMLNNKNSGFNGLSKAVEYYSIAPNPTNEYYVQRLLEKNVPIDSNTIFEVIDIPNMFQQFISRVPNDYNSLTPILLHAVKKNNMDVFKLMWDKILGLNLTQDNMNTLTGKIFDDALRSSNLEVLELISFTHNWKTIKMGQAQINVPIIYWAVINSNKILFDYFFNKYEKLTKLELELVPGIKNINEIFTSKYDFVTNEKTYELAKYCLDKIFQLPIEFDGMGLAVGKIIESMICRTIYGWDFTKVLKANEYKYQLIYWLIKNNKVKSNPFELISSSLLSIDSHYKSSESRLKHSADKMTTYKNFFKNIILLMSHFNYEPSKLIKDKFEAIYGKDTPEVWEANKKAFIDKIDAVNNVVKKARKTRAKKVNAEIEV